MPLMQYSFPLSPGSPEIVGRGFALSFPVDWLDVVITTGRPLPVVVVLHGGAMMPVSFLNQQMQITTWWDGSWRLLAPPPLIQLPPIQLPGDLPRESPPVPVPFPQDTSDKIKAIVIAPQGLSLNEDLGGDWNSGNVGATNRWAAIDDYTFILDCIERAEAFFQRAWEEMLQQDGPAHVAQLQWFDRQRINLVGFSNGGQMAYLLANRLRHEGWHVKGLVGFGCSIGGWYTQARQNLPPDVDWTPRALGATSIRGIRTPSVLHVHGKLDKSVQPYVSGPSVKTHDSTIVQLVDPGRVAEFARADISGRDSALSYVGLYDAETGVARTTTDYPPAIAGLTTLITTAADDYGFAWASFAWKWQDPTGSAKKVIFAHIDTLDHAVPPWGPAAVIQFLRDVGGLD